MSYDSINKRSFLSPAIHLHSDTVGCRRSSPVIGLTCVRTQVRQCNRSENVFWHVTLVVFHLRLRVNSSCLWRSEERGSMVVPFHQVTVGFGKPYARQYNLAGDPESFFLSAILCQLWQELFMLRSTFSVFNLLLNIRKSYRHSAAFIEGTDPLSRRFLASSPITSSRCGETFLFADESISSRIISFLHKSEEPVSLGSKTDHNSSATGYDSF